MAKWRGGKIKLRARMLVGSKSDDMVIVKVVIPDILFGHGFPPPRPSSINYIIIRVQEYGKALQLTTETFQK